MKEIKKSVILFAGTTEGRLLAEYLQELDRPFVICVATGYGRDLLEIYAGRTGPDAWRYARGAWMSRKWSRCLMN